MEDFTLLADLYRGTPRQGPGGEEQTRLALELGQLQPSPGLAVADIGCGTGASALLLARALEAQVTAVDFLPDFIDGLRQRAQEEGLSDRIRPLQCSMDCLPFENQQYDLLWSEGAVYNMGFENGVREWQRFLKPGGLLVVSELIWTTPDRPAEIQAYWDQAYPEVATAATKLRVLENCGYAAEACFQLPQSCWMENYYGPLQQGFEAFLARHGHSAEAETLVAEQEEEIELYRRFGGYFSYGMFIARRPA